MTAAAARAELAAIGRDLMAVLGGGHGRGAALLGQGKSQAETSFADLALAPLWLRRPRDDQRRTAVRVAMMAMAPTIAASIDGEWLGQLARLADENLLDQAIAGTDVAPDGGLGSVPADQVETAGFDLMRATLPAALQAYLDWAPGGVAVGASPALARFAVDRA